MMARVKQQYPNMKSSDLQASQVFVVDMIKGFCEVGAMSDIRITDIIPNIEKLLTLPSQVKEAIFFIDAHEEDAIEFNSFPKHCVKGTEEAEIVDALQPYVTSLDNVIYKNSTNGFHELQTYQEEILQHPTSIKEIIISGCCTDICVFQFALTLKTWLNAKDIAMRVIIPVDCVDTYDSGNDYHEAVRFNEMALTLMGQAGIEIVEKIEI
jgi:nicotinamidase-related amidase